MVKPTSNHGNATGAHQARGSGADTARTAGAPATGTTQAGLTPTQQFAQAYAEEEHAVVDSVSDGRELGEKELLTLQFTTSRMVNALKAHTGALNSYQDSAMKIIGNIS